MRDSRDSYRKNIASQSRNRKCRDWAYLTLLDHFAMKELRRDKMLYSIAQFCIDSREICVSQVLIPRAL